MLHFFLKEQPSFSKFIGQNFFQFLETVQRSRERQGICAEQVTVVVPRNDLYMSNERYCSP